MPMATPRRGTQFANMATLLTALVQVHAQSGADNVVELFTREAPTMLGMTDSL